MTRSTHIEWAGLLVLLGCSWAYAADDARVVAQDLPSQLSPNQTVQASVTVENTGTTAWTRATGFKLGTVGDQDPFYSRTRVWLPTGVTVRPGQRYTFRFDLSAPSQLGVHTTDWRMVHEGVRWFGAVASQQVRVVDPSAATTDQSRLVSARLPAGLSHGESFAAELRFENTGTSTWTRAAGIKLGAAGDSDPLFPTNRVRLPDGVSIPPGGRYTFRLTLTAPGQDATLTTDWRLLREGVAWFGETATQQVRVGTGGGPEFKLIVTSYPWVGARSHPISKYSLRSPERSAGDTILSQATPAYGQYVADLCNRYEIDILSGYWQIVRNGTMDTFQASFPRSVRLGRLRLVYMAGLLGFDDPNSRQVIEATIKSWRADTQDRSRYGYLTDSSNTPRPIIMVWGDWAHRFPAELKAMIERIRAHYQQVGLNPFFIMTEHALHADERILRSMDAVYQHQCPIPPVGQVWSTARSRQELEPVLTRRARMLNGKRAYSTNLPIPFLPGTMPQFDRHRLEVNFEGGVPTHGIVRAGSKREVLDMFRLVHRHAPTLGGGHRWGVLTSWAEWAEGSTLEPTRAQGPKYGPSGHYQRDFVEAIGEVFRAR